MALIDRRLVLAVIAVLSLAALVAGGETQHRNHGEYEATVDQGHGSLPDD